MHCYDLGRSTPPVTYSNYTLNGWFDYAARYPTRPFVMTTYVGHGVVDGAPIYSHTY